MIHNIRIKLVSLFFGCAILVTFGLENGGATVHIDVPKPKGKECHSTSFRAEACKKACGAENWEARSECKKKDIITCFCKGPVQK
jgi:hypothetical protein